jgi:N-acetylmuramoyl-L-alanine amidase CwlA
MGKTISTGYISATINGIAVKSNIKAHPGNYDDEAKRNTSYIVMHYTGNDDDNAENNAKYFNGNDVDVSAHFFVDETRIHQSVELRDEAWHCGTDGKYYHSKCRNANSIGIEMTTAGKYKISAETIENSAYLCAYLCEMLNIKSSDVDTYVLRHYDVTHKRCPAQFVDNPNEWGAFKSKVKSILKAKEKATTKELYRVRKSWKDAASQTGAFSVLDNAIAQAKKDKLNVYDSKGKAVYTYKATAKAVTKGCKVKVKKGAKDYNGNSVASFVYDKVYKVDELNGKRAVLDLKGICTAFHIDNLVVQ